MARAGATPPRGLENARTLSTIAQGQRVQTRVGRFADRGKPLRTRNHETGSRKQKTSFTTQSRRTTYERKTSRGRGIELALRETSPQDVLLAGNAALGVGEERSRR